MSPPIRRGVFVTSQFSFAGSTLSGADAYRYWFPSIGAITLRRVPGKDVDSLIISEFAFKFGFIELQADSMNERSGSRLLVSGVGTARMMTSESLMFE